MCINWNSCHLVKWHQTYTVCHLNTTVQSRSSYHHSVLELLTQWVYTSYPISKVSVKASWISVYDWHLGSLCGWTCNQLTSKVDEVGSSGQFSPSVWPHNLATGFQPPSGTVVSAEPFSHGTGTLWCLQKEMATYRHWSVSLWRDPDDVSNCRILSPDKTEWRLISATLCG